jgi:hypothetical protein
MLDALRQRFVVLAYGQGRWENPDENWRMADMLGAKGIPNRVPADINDGILGEGVLPAQLIGQRTAVEQRHSQKGVTILLTKIEHRYDGGMGQAAAHLRFPPETGPDCFGIRGRKQNF